MTPSARNSVQADTGSPSSGEPVHLLVGRLRRPHGVRGEILMDVLVDLPDWFVAGKQLFVGEDFKLLKLASVRNHAKGLLVRFDGYSDRETVGIFRNQPVSLLTSELPEPPQGEFYDFQLIGIQVFNDSSDKLGTLKEIIKTGANDVYVIHRVDGRELLLPAIPSVILNVDLDSKIMKVHLLPGLDEENNTG